MSNRVLIGKFPAGDNSPNGYGLRISKPGYEVTVANPDNEQLIFNSDWPEMLPIHAVGIIDVKNSTVTKTFDDLGYIPHSSCMVRIKSGWPVASQGWQQYVSSNNIIRQTSTVGLSKVSKAQIYCLNYTGDAYDKMQVNVFSNSIKVYSTEDAAVYYTIYKLKAFDV